MVVRNITMEEDDDLEALRLAALQTIRPRKPTSRRPVVSNTHKQLGKGPFIRSIVNPNLISIVPSVLPPPTIDSGKVSSDSSSKPLEESTKKTCNNSKELHQTIEKKETKPEIIKPEEKHDEDDKISDDNKKEAKCDKSEVFDLEEDVLDFETESLGGSEEDTLQLHDSDSDSLERLMEQIEEELSAPIKGTRLKQKTMSLVPRTSENNSTKVTNENISRTKVKSSPKPESPKPLVNTSNKLSPSRLRYSPAKNINSPGLAQSSPKRSRSPHSRRRSITPRKRSITPRKRSLTPRKRSLTPRKRSLTPRKRSLTPRKRSLTPRKRSITPRKRSITPRKRSLTPRKRSLSPRRRSLSPRRRSISPSRRSLSPRKRSLTPRKRSLTPRRRSITPRKRSISPRRRSPWRFSPRRRSISPRNRRSISPRRRSPIDRRRSPSPWRRSLSPRRQPLSPRRRSLTPKKRSLSPRRRSLTPKKLSPPPRKRSLSPRKRSVSPKQSFPLKRQRLRSPVNTKRVKRTSPVGGRRAWIRTKTSAVGNRQKDLSKTSYNSNNKNLKEDDKRKKIDMKDFNKPKDKDSDLVNEKGDHEPKNGEGKPADPKLEARRRKFESNSLVEPLNKKIRLKSESSRVVAEGGGRGDENQTMRIKRKRIVLSGEDRSVEKAQETKAKPLLPKVTNNLKKMDIKRVEEEVVVKKKRKEVVQELPKEESNKKGVDLRAELSRRRAERLKGASIDPMARIVQSAIEGAVGKIKSKARASSPVSDDEAPATERKSKPKGRRVHVLPANSSKTESKKNVQEKNIGISMQYRSSPPLRGSGRSILRRNQQL